MDCGQVAVLSELYVPHNSPPLDHIFLDDHEGYLAEGYFIGCRLYCEYLGPRLRADCQIHADVEYGISCSFDGTAGLRPLRGMWKVFIKERGIYTEDFQVAHRDSQFELHDYRAHFGRPSLRFGFITSAVNGRYMKGDIRGNTFVSGDRNGLVRQWDVRKAIKPVQNVGLDVRLFVCHS